MEAGNGILDCMDNWIKGLRINGVMYSERTNLLHKN